MAGTEALGGALLLINRFVPLALALLATVIVNIVFFHVFLSSLGIVLAFVVLFVEIYLAWVYRHTFRSMLAMCATPGGN